jgi:hypothetical protein
MTGTSDADSGSGEDRLADLKREIAAQHLGDADLGERLKGGNAAQLRDDAERLRDEAHLPDRGRPSLEAAVHVWHRRRAYLTERLFGWRS